MEWQGKGTAVARRRHGEHAVILTVLTRELGLISGVVPGGASVRRAAILQPGNRLSLRWRARLDDQLGSFTVAPGRTRAGLMADADALAGLNAVTALIAWALPGEQLSPIQIGGMALTTFGVALATRRSPTKAEIRT